MTPTRAHPGSLRTDAVARAIALGWRRLAPLQARTLLACSGGADSSAMVLALAGTIARPGERFVVAHIVHDVRPEAEALADRDAVRALAARCALPMVEAEIRARPVGGNLEAAARRERYRALERLGQREGCVAIATAHHADDQLETLLMAIIRGSGVRGLRGVSSARTLGSGLRLIRPCLTVERAHLVALCERSGWAWRDDRTNADVTRLRARLRAEVLPALRAVRPAVCRHADALVGDLRGLAALADARAAEARSLATSRQGALVWPRSALAAISDPVLGDVIRRAAEEVVGPAGLDRRSRVAIDRVVRAVRDEASHPREWTIGGALIRVTVREVEVTRATARRV